jgi:hypothetical protein
MKLVAGKPRMYMLSPGVAPSGTLERTDGSSFSTSRTVFACWSCAFFAV